MITKLNETYTLELRAGITGWSVDLYSWLKDGSRAYLGGFPVDFQRR